MDALRLLADEHRRLEALFRRYERLEARDLEGRDRFRIEFIHELVAHAEIEEQIFYPLLREAMPELAEEVHMDLEWHREVEDLLARLDAMAVDHSGFGPTIGEIITKVREHVEDDGNRLHPKVREAFDADTLDDLGTAMEGFVEVAPTRSDPLDPSADPDDVLGGEAPAALERAREAARRIRPS